MFSEGQVPLLLSHLWMNIHVKGSGGIEFKANRLIKECMEEAFDLIVLLGGIPGAQNLWDSKELEILLKK